MFWWKKIGDFLWNTVSMKNVLMKLYRFWWKKFLIKRVGQKGFDEKGERMKGKLTSMILMKKCDEKVLMKEPLMKVLEWKEVLMKKLFGEKCFDDIYFGWMGV